MSENSAHPQIPGLDYEVGLTYAETPEILNALLRDFHADIPKRCAAMQRALREGEIESFEREVHSLKSCARLIGAEELSRMAAELEGYAKLKNIGAIQLRIPALIVKYRAYISALAPFAKEKVTEKIKLGEEERRALLEKLSAFLDSFDLDGAQRITERLQNSELPEEDENCYAALFEAVGDVEYDVAGELAKLLLGE